MAAMATYNADAEPSRAVKLCGTSETNAPSRKLAAGPLTVEIENGQLRYVTFAGTEVLRGIAFLVRDENWGAYTPKIKELEIEEGTHNSAVTYRAVCADARQRLVYRARISGSSDGSLALEVAALPQTDVATNRTGFVVLHPTDWQAGQGDPC
jgi:D-apionolactonase